MSSLGEWLMNVSEQLNMDTIDSYKERTVLAGESPEVLTGIYQEISNIVIWRRQLSPALNDIANDLLRSDMSLQVVTEVTPQSAYYDIYQILEGLSCAKALSEDIANLVDMFCCLFDLKRAGLRLTTLEHAMCPRFHVDNVPCRLVTTYNGIGTQWLPHQMVDRCRLGAGNQGLSDELSGLYQNATNIEQLVSGDVALLKGESWYSNENAGLVHRSPSLRQEEKRLLLTLDFLS